MNYFNKALDTFSTNVYVLAYSVSFYFFPYSVIRSVNPMYYVCFSTATLVASLILFQGFNTTDATNTLSLLSGFIVTFLGVHLLNLSRIPEPPLDHNGHGALEGGLMNPRLSLQGRMSLDGWNGTGERGDVATPTRPGRHGRQSSLYRAQTATLYNAFDEPSSATENVGLHRLKEEDETDEDDDAHDSTELTLLRKKREGKGRADGSSLPNRTSGSRSLSHSPIPSTSLGDVRISPRPS